MLVLTHVKPTPLEKHSGKKTSNRKFYFNPSCVFLSAFIMELSSNSFYENAKL